MITIDFKVESFGNLQKLIENLAGMVDIDWNAEHKKKTQILEDWGINKTKVGEISVFISETHY